MRNSRVILCSGINLDRNYINVLNYTEEEMLELCLEHKVAEVNNYSFIRQNRDNLYTSFTYSQVLNSNYIAFQNKDYDNKWFFAFIDEVIYRGEKNTEIKYTIDSWSTWFNKITIKPCLVKRHHVNNDTIGANTIEENIVNGVMIEERSQTDDTDLNNVYFAISTSVDPSNATEYVGVNNYNGILHGKIIFLFDTDLLGINGLSYFIDHTNQLGRIADIENLFIVPKNLVINNYVTRTDTYTPSGRESSVTYEYKKLTRNPDAIEGITLIPFNYNFNDYTPKNNKCFCYPYNYLQVSNNIGNIGNYRYEDFEKESDGEPINYISFAIQMAISVGCSIRAVPMGYKKQDYNIDESIPLAKYPTCSWTADAYTNWLTQNAVNNTTYIAQKAFDATALIAVGQIPAGIFTISDMAQKIISDGYQQSLQPSIQGGQNTGDVNFSSKNNNFVFRQMRLKTEYMKQVDDYFSRFGYKIARVILPNITGRRYWNYVEIGESEEIGNGNIPSIHQEIINKAFRKGVTIWHNHENIGNYNLNNTII